MVLTAIYVPPYMSCLPYMSILHVLTSSYVTREQVSVGAGYGILVWDLLIDTNEDISEFVDRLIDERIAEQQVWFSRYGSAGLVQ